MAGSSRAAVIGAVGAVTAAVVAGLFGLVSCQKQSDPGVTINNNNGEGNSINSGAGSAPAAPPSPDAAAGPTATIETAASVPHGQPLDLEGTVQGLNGRAMWIVTFPDEGAGFYLISDGPIT